MAEIIWTEPALADLNNIADYVALDNRVATSQLVQKVFAAVERLDLSPQSGRVPPELPQLNYRELIVSPCRVFYKQEGEKVFILFVMRTERDLRRFLLRQE